MSAVLDPGPPRRQLCALFTQARPLDLVEIAAWSAGRTVVSVARLQHQAFLSDLSLPRLVCFLHIGRQKPARKVLNIFHAASGFSP